MPLRSIQATKEILKQCQSRDVFKNILFAVGLTNKRSEAA